MAAFEQEGISSLTSMKDQLDRDSHPQAKTIKDRHANVIKRYRLSEHFYSNCRGVLISSHPCIVATRWEKLKKDSDGHRARLQRSLEQFKKV